MGREHISEGAKVSIKIKCSRLLQARWTNYFRNLVHCRFLRWKSRVVYRIEARGVLSDWCGYFFECDSALMGMGKMPIQWV